jgi:hypothetical protein
MFGLLIRILMIKGGAMVGRVIMGNIIFLLTHSLTHSLTDITWRRRGCFCTSAGVFKSKKDRGLCLSLTPLGSDKKKRSKAIAASPF